MKPLLSRRVMAASCIIVAVALSILAYAQMEKTMMSYDSNASVCRHYLKKIWFSLEHFRSDHGSYPCSSEGTPAALSKLYPMISSEEFFVCPASGDKPGSSKDGLRLTKETCSYEFLPVVIGIEVHGDSSNSPIPADIVMVYDKKPYHQGSRIVLFGGSKVELMAEEDFQKSLEKSKAWYQALSKDRKPGE